VRWSCDTNIGDFTIEYLDRTSRSVYNTPDPGRYTIIQPGDPVSKTHGYTNYIKAVPETLFRPAELSLREKYLGFIPKYPDDIYDIYRIKRVLAVGISLPNIDEWNAKLSDALKKLGPQRQANAVIVLTKIASTDYFYALQDAWLNGKKNDIVLVIGAPDFPGKPAWVRVMALTQDELFQIKLRDRIMALDSLTADSVIGALHDEAFATFKRKSMKDFAYLDAEIDPPAWVMITCSILMVLAYAGFWIFTYRNRDSSQFTRYGVPRFRYRY